LKGAVMEAGFGAQKIVKYHTCFHSNEPGHLETCNWTVVLLFFVCQWISHPIGQMHRMHGNSWQAGNLRCGRWT
jgi:hypothetical protein